MRSAFSKIFSNVLNREQNVQECDPSTSFPIIIGTTQLMITEQKLNGASQQTIIVVLKPDTKKIY